MSNFDPELPRVLVDMDSVLADFDGALDGWQRLMDEGFQPQICSSPIGRNPYSEQEKLGWLDRHFVPVFGPLGRQNGYYHQSKTRIPWRSFD